MKRTPRFRPALESLEDRCCPTIMYYLTPGNYLNPAPTPASNAANNGPLGIVDNDTTPTLNITYMGSQKYHVVDSGTSPAAYDFTGVTSISVTLGGTQDSLVFDGNFTNLGFVPLPGYVSVALDGTAPSGSPNSFTFQDTYLNNNNNASTGTLYVLGQGANNNVTIGKGGFDFADAVNVNITYRDAANGPNPGTLNNGVNNTTMNRLWTNGVSLSSQSAFATDNVTMGSSVVTTNDPNTGVIENYGPANFAFNKNNNFNLTVANGMVGSTSLPNATFTVTGGGPTSVVNIGDGAGQLLVQTGQTNIDLDDTSGNADGTINVAAGVTLQSGTVERFDDYGTVNIGTGGGSVNLAKPLTIWNSRGGTVVSVGDPTNTNPGTVTGSITFATGFIPADTDDPGSSASVVDVLALGSQETLTGTLTANLSNSMDVVDVEGHMSGALVVNGSNGSDTVYVGATTPGATATVGGGVMLSLGNASFDTVQIGAAPGAGAPTATITGNSTISFGSGTQDSLTVGGTGVFKNHLAIALGSTGVKTLEFAGTVGSGLEPVSTVVLTVSSGSNAVVTATLDSGSQINGSASMTLTSSASNTVTWAATSVATGTLSLTTSTGHMSANVFHHTTHVAGTLPDEYKLLGDWNDMI